MATPIKRFGAPGQVKHVADLVGRPAWKGGLNPAIQVRSSWLVYTLLCS